MFTLVTVRNLFPVSNLDQGGLILMQKETAKLILFFVLQMICIASSSVNESYLGDVIRIMTQLQRKTPFQRIMKRTA